MPLPAYCFLPDHYILDVETSRSVCSCGCRLQRKWLKRRKVIGILFGRARVHHHIKQCPSCQKVYPCKQLNTVVPPQCTYAYDIMVEVGLARFRHRMQTADIQRSLLHRYQLDIPSTTINVLVDRFVTYFAAVHYAHAPLLRKIMTAEGGYPLYVDGTCEAGTDVFFALVHGTHKWVLDCGQMPTENRNDITRLLRQCDVLYGKPLVVLRDLSDKIQQALQAVFPDTPELVCHYHFLLNVGRKLLQDHHLALTKRIRSLNIAATFHSLRRDLMRYSQKGPPLDQNVLIRLHHNPKHLLSIDQKHIQRYLAYLILLWLNDFGHDLKGEYFPFDLPYLAYYRRCRTLSDLLMTLLDASHLSEKGRNTFLTIAHHLLPIREDEKLLSFVSRIEKSEQLFNKLRTVMSLKCTKKKPLLRQTGLATTMARAKNLKSRVSRFRMNLENSLASGNDPDYRHDTEIILAYLDKYWQHLFGHVLVLSPGAQTLLLDRTNNILETKFSVLKHDLRRRLGTKKVNRLLNAMRPEQMLIANLTLQSYVNVIYNGSIDTIAQIFSRHWSVAEEYRKKKKQKAKAHFSVSVKTLRQPDFLKNVSESLMKVMENEHAA